jgi:hypothetical protein
MKKILMFPCILVVLLVVGSANLSSYEINNQDQLSLKITDNSSIVSNAGSMPGQTAGENDPIFNATTVLVLFIGLLGLVGFNRHRE